MHNCNDKITISVIIPVYNEENTLKTLLKKVIDSDVCKLKKEIIIIQQKTY